GETDPNKADTDNGGVNDGDEIKNGTDPLISCDDNNSCTGTTGDSDGDGIPDVIELSGQNKTDPNNPDTDGDGLCDGSESVADVCVGGEDKNNNGQIDEGETDPNKADSDGDGISDHTELFGENRTNPLNPDTDGDGLCDGSKAIGGCIAGEDKNNNGKVDSDETDPNNPDSDSGGVKDGQEVRNGTDPLLPCDDTGSCNGNSGQNGNGNGNGDGNGNGLDNESHGYADDDCACQSVMAQNTSHFPVLASLFAMIFAAFLGLRRRRDTKA
ncbi:MAG: hypothetical protein IJU23_00420, partial [Proteobacteria bacterium]|nr:hypothetical protein [Pseudomonadota bacterium]